MLIFRVKFRLFCFLSGIFSVNINAFLSNASMVLIFLRDL